MFKQPDYIKRFMLRFSATAPICLKNRRRGILPRPQRLHRACTPFLHEPIKKAVETQYSVPLRLFCLWISYLLFFIPQVDNLVDGINVGFRARFNNVRASAMPNNYISVVLYPDCDFADGILPLGHSPDIVVCE